MPNAKEIDALDKTYEIDGEEIKPTIKQLKFVRAYILNGGNATQASIDAGYSEKTAQRMGSENLSKPLIKLMLSEVKEEEAEVFSISVERKKRWLEEIVERSLQHEAVTDHEGNETGEYKFDGSNAIRAINELNKMDGDHSAEKKKVELETEGMIFNLNYGGKDE